MRPLSIIFSLSIILTYQAYEEKPMEPTEYEIDRALPGDRSFYMGFTALRSMVR